ncbi:MAG TPA: MBL fold metallo-hydrolase [Thermoanaerobaculia bacterium]|nr:MBL fold metallo-hydrolase [Thermoanaerobaculia bacterium]
MLLALLLAATLSDPLAANHQAIRALERSLDAHGRDDPKVTFSVRSDLVAEGQSLAVLPPFETYPLSVDAVLDPATKRMRVASSWSIAGDFTFSDIVAVQDGKGIGLTPELRAHREVTGEPPILNRYMPHRYIRQLLNNRTALRALDDRTILSGSQTIYLDEKGLLHRVVQVLPTNGGDGVRETVYEDYKKTGNILLPSRLRTRVTSSVYGTVENVYRYEGVRAEAAFGEKDFTVPEGYTKPDYSYRGAFATRELAKDVWLLENVTRSTGQWSYNVMVVAFDTFVLVTEAPVDSATSERVLEKIRELAPGKPVRYLVQSHHHDDHIGGIRTYIAEGTTIVTTEAVKPLVEKLAAAPFLLTPDRLGRSPREPKLELVRSRMTVSDDNHSAVIRNIGPTPHARDLLMVYLPKEKILYQADMINEGEYPDNAGTREFRKKIEGLDVKTIVGLHGKVVTVD